MKYFDQRMCAFERIGTKEMKTVYLYVAMLMSNFDFDMFRSNSKTHRLLG